MDVLGDLFEGGDLALCGERTARGIAQWTGTPGGGAGRIEALHRWRGRPRAA
jgi:hypothetical protein